MKVIIFLSLVSYIACHQWYKGPYRFIFIKRLPRPLYPTGPVVGGASGISGTGSATTDNGEVLPPPLTSGGTVLVESQTATDDNGVVFPPPSSSLTSDNGGIIPPPSSSLTSDNGGIIPPPSAGIGVSSTDEFLNLPPGIEPGIPASSDAGFVAAPVGSGGDGIPADGETVVIGTPGSSGQGGAMVFAEGGASEASGPGIDPSGMSMAGSGSVLQLGNSMSSGGGYLTYDGQSGEASNGGGYLTYDGQSGEASNGGGYIVQGNFIPNGDYRVGTMKGGYGKKIKKTWFKGADVFLNHYKHQHIKGFKPHIKFQHLKIAGTW